MVYYLYMRKLKAMYHVFYRSLVSLKYYNEVVRTNLKFSLKYFFLLVVIISLLTAGVLSARNTPTIQKEVTSNLTQAKSLYPEDLVVTAKNNSLSINKPEPYIIKSPETFKDFPKNFLVFDSKGILDSIKENETFILINSTNILISDPSTEKVEVYPIKNLPDGQLTKTDFDNLIAKLQGFAKYIPAFLFVAVLLGLIIYNVLFRLVYLLIVAVILMLAGKTKKLSLRYVQYYKIAIHAITIPLLVEFLLTAAGVNIGIPLWFFALNTVFGLLAVSKISNDVVTP